MGRVVEGTIMSIRIPFGSVTAELTSRLNGTPQPKGITAIWAKE